MKIPDSAFEPILQMVAGSLPYSEAFDPVTPEAEAVVGIVSEVIQYDSIFGGLEGFMYFIAERIDKTPKKQESSRLLLLTLIDKLQAYERAYEKGHSL